MDGPPNPAPAPANDPARPILAGGGLMGDRVRAHDWAATPFGPLEDWPPSLRVAVSLCLDTPVPTGVFFGADFRLVYNDAYAEMLADRHPWALGRPGAEVWSDAWEIIGPQFAAVVATGRGFSSDSQRFDLVRNGRTEETYFQYSFNPLRDEAGRVVGIFNFGMEVTERVLAERRGVAEIERLREMFEQAPGAISVSRGPDHVFEIANRAYRRVLGDRPMLGRPVRAAVPELEAQGFVAQMDRAYASGEPFIARRAELHLPVALGGPPATFYFDYIYQPLTDATGAVTGLFVEATDITDQVAAEERARCDERRRAFRAELTDTLGGLADPVAVIAGASELLGRHLGATRVSYGEVDEAAGTITVQREWNDGSVPSVLGVLPLDDFGPIMAEMRRGGAVTVADVATDPRIADPAHLAGFRAIGVAALLAAPLVKEGRLVAGLGIHSGRPRAWSADDVALALEVAEQTWAAVEQARAETALRRSEALHRSVVEQASDGIWLADAAGRYLDVNPAACAILGYTRDEYLAMSITDLILPENQARLADLMGRLLGGARLQEVGHFRRKDGQVIPLDLSLSCLPDGRPLAIGRDITGRLRAEERDRRAAAEAVAAAEANAKFRAFYEQGAYFASVLALDGTVLDSNRVSYDACGYRPDEVIGRAFWECGWWDRDPILAGKIRQAVARAADGTAFRGEQPFFLAGGSRRQVDLFLTPVVDDSGRVRFVAATGVDVTDRKRAEDDLRTLAADLSNADHRKDEFLAMLGHELRNPLSAISGAMQLAELTEAPGLTVELRDLIHRQVGHLTRLIDDLLDVSRITQGKIALRTTTVDLAEAVRRAVDLVRPLVAAKRHTLAVAVPDRPVHLIADPTRVEQVLGNLLTNAAKYTEPGGRIDLVARLEGAEVVVQVRDTGVGIGPEMLPEVFGLFTQVDATIDRAQGGLGIGLTLVRTLVEMHGGTVTAASAGKGLGSEFTVRLPIGRCDAEVPTAEPPSPAPRPVGGVPRQVLVVDDNRDTARLTARMLRHAGFEVEVAHDGLEAVRVAPGLRPGVVLLDIGLPGMNGYEVAAALRRDPACQGATIIAVSGYGEDKARERSAAAGFDHHLAKPVDFARLITLIEV